MLQSPDRLPHQRVQIVGRARLGVVFPSSLLLLRLLNLVLIPERDPSSDQPQERKHPTQYPNVGAVQRQPPAEEPNQHQINQQY